MRGFRSGQPTFPSTGQSPIQRLETWIADFTREVNGRIAREAWRIVMKEHVKWVNTKGEEGTRLNGCRADLRCAEFYCADLRGADFDDANFTNATLNEAIRPEGWPQQPLKDISTSSP